MKLGQIWLVFGAHVPSFKVVSEMHCQFQAKKCLCSQFLKNKLADFK